MKLPANARFSTVCIHAGQEPDPSTGAIITPIFQTSTYVQEELGRHKGFEYARTQNPTRLALELNIAAIEGGRGAYAFASSNRVTRDAPGARRGCCSTGRKTTAIRISPPCATAR